MKTTLLQKESKENIFWAMFIYLQIFVWVWLIYIQDIFFFDMADITYMACSHNSVHPHNSVHLLLRII